MEHSIIEQARGLNMHARRFTIVCALFGTFLLTNAPALADLACDPTQFFEHKVTRSSVAQALALKDLREHSNSTGSNSGTSASGSYGPVSGSYSESHSNTTQDTSLSDYEFESNSNSNADVDALYISSMYEKCLLFNSDGLKVREVSGSPDSERIRFHTDWTAQNGDTSAKRFKFEVSNSGYSTHAPAQWFVGNASDDFIVEGRNKDQETDVTISVLNSHWQQVKSYQVTIPARLHIYGNVPSNSQMNVTMHHFYSHDNADDEWGGQWMTPDPNTTIVGYNFNFENAAGHFDHYVWDGQDLSSDRRVLKVHGKLYQQGGYDGSIDLVAYMTLQTLQRKDVTDDPLFLNINP